MAVIYIWVCGWYTGAMAYKIWISDGNYRFDRRRALPHRWERGWGKVERTTVGCQGQVGGSFTQRAQTSARSASRPAVGQGAGEEHRINEALVAIETSLSLFG